MKVFEKKKPFLFATAFFIVLLAGILLAGPLFFSSGTHSLLVKDPRNEAVYYNVEVKSGDIFTFTCRNSVSKSVVTGTFMITGEGLIEPLTTVFTAYGPGLPIDFMEEYVIEDGAVTIFHKEEPRENIRLWVSPQTEETIYLHNQVYPLSTLSESPLLLQIYLIRNNLR